MLDDKQIALVTGATGAVGPTLVRELTNKGYAVRVLVRRAPAPGLLPPTVRVMYGDVTERTTLDDAVEGCDVVFHLAAKLHINNPSKVLCREYERVNVQGTKNIIEAAVPCGVRRLIYFSSICIYDTNLSETEWQTETSSPGLETMYAQTKFQGEQIALAAQNGFGNPLCTVLRLAAVYGPHMRGNYCTLARMLRKGRFVYVGNGQNRRTLVMDADVARAALLAAQAPQAAGQTYNVTDGQIHTLQQIVETICGVQGIKPPRLHLPAGAMRRLAGLVQNGAKAVGIDAPITPALIDKLTEDVAVSGTKIERELGFMPEFNLRQGWETTLKSGNI